MATFEYAADGDIVRRFFSSTAFVRCLRGPVGSGKSVACCIEIFRRACEQEPSPLNGIRKTRWAVIRNTAPELKTTTIKTWLDWFDEETYGKFNWSPPFTHRLKRGDIDCEVIFIALDKPEDVKKLLSLELTGVFINEAREVSKAIVDGATMRVGRFPSKRDGGPTWSGVIMDTNSPDEDHWWAIMSGEVPPPDFMTEEEILSLVQPPNWEFFKQPGAMLREKDKDGRITGYKINPKRENANAIPPKYYKQMIEGKTHEWINVYVCNEYGTLVEGRPVYPQFDRQLHVSPDPLARFEGHETYVGVDFGLTPACVFGQKVRGRWYVLREIVAQDMGASRFANLLRNMMARLGGDFSVWGDPAGDQRAQTDENTPFRIFRAAGILIRAAPSNDPALRIDASSEPLQRLVEKQPGVVIDPGCRNLIKGFDGGYHYRRLKVSGSEKYDEKPDKNRFSHVHDAYQYMMLGAGEGRQLLTGKAGQTKAINKGVGFNVFDKRGVKPKKTFLNW